MRPPQSPKTKSVAQFWMMTFKAWEEAGYTLEDVHLTLLYAKANGLSIVSPVSLWKDEMGLLEYVHGERENGNTFDELVNPAAEDDDDEASPTTWTGH